MFDISSSELLVIVLVALIVFGPSHLPDLMRKAGRAYGELQRAMSELRTGLESELEEARRPFDEAAAGVRKPLEDTAGQVRDAVDEVRKGTQAALPHLDDPAAGAGPPETGVTAADPPDDPAAEGG